MYIRIFWIVVPLVAVKVYNLLYTVYRCVSLVSQPCVGLSSWRTFYCCRCKSSSTLFTCFPPRSPYYHVSSRPNLVFSRHDTPLLGLHATSTTYTSTPSRRIGPLFPPYTSFYFPHLIISLYTFVSYI